MKNPPSPLIIIEDVGQTSRLHPLPHPASAPRLWSVHLIRQTYRSPVANLARFQQPSTAQSTHLASDSPDTLDLPFPDTPGLVARSPLVPVWYQSHPMRLLRLPLAVISGKLQILSLPHKQKQKWSNDVLDRFLFRLPFVPLPRQHTRDLNIHSGWCHLLLARKEPAT